MRTTGITRKIDELGRIVLPAELRRTLGLASRDTMEIYVEGDSVVLKKFGVACVFCGNSENIVAYREKSVCPACLSYLKDM